MLVGDDGGGTGTAPPNEPAKCSPVHRASSSPEINMHVVDEWRGNLPSRTEL